MTILWIICTVVGFVLSLLGVVEYTTSEDDEEKISCILFILVSFLLFISNLLSLGYATAYHF